jgi:hypothetical protein
MEEKSKSSSEHKQENLLEMMGHFFENMFFPHHVEGTAEISPGHRRRSSSVPSKLPALKLKDDKVSNILAVEEMQCIRDLALSRWFQLEEWSRLYSLTRHGASIRTLMNQCEDRGACVFLFKPSDVDKSGRKAFGVFLSESVHVCSAADAYVGSFDCCVFTVYPDGKVIPFHSTRKNAFFGHFQETFISFGGGSHFAIHVDSELFHCSSGFCETFDSPALVDDESELFPIADMEVWGVEPDKIKSKAQD